MPSKTLEQKNRVTIKFSWPWARLRSVFGSRRAGERDDHGDEGEIDTPREDGRRKTRKDRGARQRTNVLSDSMTGSKRDKSRSGNVPRHKPTPYVDESLSREDWQASPRLSIRQHIELMREGMRKRANKKVLFSVEAITGGSCDDDYDRCIVQPRQNRTSPSTSTPTWMAEWQALKDAGDPVVKKTAEDLADMSALAGRLRKLRLEYGLAPGEERMQEGSTHVPPRAHSHGTNMTIKQDPVPGVPNYPFCSTSSRHRDPRFFLQNCPYNPIKDTDRLTFSKSTLYKSPWMRPVYVWNRSDVILPVGRVIH